MSGRPLAAAAYAIVILRKMSLTVGVSDQVIAASKDPRNILGCHGSSRVGATQRSFGSNFFDPADAPPSGSLFFDPTYMFMCIYIYIYIYM